MRGVGNEANAVRDIKKDVVLTRRCVHHRRVEFNAGSIAVAEIPEVGIPLGRGILKGNAEIAAVARVPRSDEDENEEGEEGFDTTEETSTEE